MNYLSSRVVDLVESKSTDELCNILCSLSYTFYKLQGTNKQYFINFDLVCFIYFTLYTRRIVSLY